MTEEEIKKRLEELKAEENSLNSELAKIKKEEEIEKEHNKYAGKYFRWCAYGNHNDWNIFIRCDEYYPYGSHAFILKGTMYEINTAVDYGKIRYAIEKDGRIVIYKKSDVLKELSEEEFIKCKNDVLKGLNLREI